MNGTALNASPTNRVALSSLPFSDRTNIVPLRALHVSSNNSSPYLSRNNSPNNSILSNNIPQQRFPSKRDKSDNTRIDVHPQSNYTTVPPSLQQTPIYVRKPSLVHSSDDNAKNKPVTLQSVFSSIRMQLVDINSIIRLIGMVTWCIMLLYIISSFIHTHKDNSMSSSGNQLIQQPVGTKMHDTDVHHEYIDTHHYNIDINKSLMLFSSFISTNQPNKLFLHSIYSWIKLMPISGVVILVHEYNECTILHKHLPTIQCQVCNCFDTVPNTVVQHSNDRATIPPSTMLQLNIQCAYQTMYLRTADVATIQLLSYIDLGTILLPSFIPTITVISNAIADKQYIVLGNSRQYGVTGDTVLPKASDELIDALDQWQHDIEISTYRSQSTATQRVDGTHDVYIPYIVYTKHTPLYHLPFNVTEQWQSHTLDLVLHNMYHVYFIDTTQSITALQLRLQYDIDIDEYHYVDTQHIVTNILQHNITYQLHGICPSCQLKLLYNIDLYELLLNTAQDDTVVVSIVNHELLPLAYNYICYMNSIQVYNYIFVAEDVQSYTALTQYTNSTVILNRFAVQHKNSSTVGSKQWSELLYFRIQLLHELIQLQYNIIYTHVDTLWYSDVGHLFNQPTFNAGTAIHDSDQQCDVYLSNEYNSERRLGGGLLVFRYSDSTTRFVNDLLLCEQENLQFIQTYGKNRFVYSDLSTTDCINMISNRLSKRHKLHKCILDNKQYVSSAQHSHHLRNQHSYVWPTVVHYGIEYNTTLTKHQYLSQWNLWLYQHKQQHLYADSIPSALHQSSEHSITNIIVSEHTSAVIVPHNQHNDHIDYNKHIQCTADHTALRHAAPIYDNATPHTIHIHILINHDIDSTDTTLQSLQSSFNNITMIQLVLYMYIVQPVGGNIDTIRQYKAILNSIHSFKSSIQYSVHTVPIDPVIDGSIEYIRLVDDTHTQHNVDLNQHQSVIMLKSGYQLSPNWLAYINTVLSTYYYNYYTYDRQLAGISLMHADTIIIETSIHRLHSRLPINELIKQNYRHDVYKYQYTAMLGTLLFSSQFNQFITWYNTVNQYSVHSMCIPNSIDNPTIASKLSINDLTIQSIYNRFLFEYGYYSLHIHMYHTTNITYDYQHNKLNYTINNAVTVIKDTADMSTLNTHMALLADQAVTLPQYDTIQLYDYHLDWITNKIHLKQRRQFYPPLTYDTDIHHVYNSTHSIPGYNISNCYTIHNRSEDETYIDDASIIRELYNTNNRKRAMNAIDTFINTHKPVMQYSPQYINQAMNTQIEQARQIANSIDVNHLTVTQLYNQLQRIGHTPDTTLQSINQTQFVQKYTFVELNTMIVPLTQHEQVHQRLMYCVYKMYLDSGLQLIENGLNMWLQHTIQNTIDYKQLLSPDQVNQYKLPVIDYTSRSMRYVLYQPPSASYTQPFDRHLRGIYFCYVISLVTNRILIIDLPGYHELYQSLLPNITHSADVYRQHVINNKAIKHSYVTVNNSMEIRLKNLDILYPNQLLIHYDLVSYDRLVFANPLYTHRCVELFNSTSRYTRTQQLMKLILDQPTPYYIDSVNHLYNHIQYTAYPHHIYIHIPLNKPPSKADLWPGITNDYWLCLHTQLLLLRHNPMNTIIYLSITSAASTINTAWTNHTYTYAHQVLQQYGTVVYNPQYNKTLLAAQLHSPLLYNDHTIRTELLHAYILRHSEVSVTAGTTYGIFNTLGTLNKLHNIIIKYNKANTELYCGDIQRTDLNTRNDVEF